MAQTTTNIQKCWGAWPPSHHPPWGGGCPIETFDFFEFSRHLWQFPSKNQAFWPAGLLLLAAACHGPNNHQHSKMLGGLAPQPPPPLGGGCPIETPRFFLNFLGTFGNSLVKFRPFGLLACCCLLLTAACHGPNNHQHSKMLGGLGPPATTPLGGWLPHRNPSIFLNFLDTFGNSLVKIRPFGLLACCCLLLTAACH